MLRGWGYGARLLTLGVGEEERVICGSCGLPLPLGNSPVLPGDGEPPRGMPIRTEPVGDKGDGIEGGGRIAFNVGKGDRTASLNDADSLIGNFDRSRMLGKLKPPVMVEDLSGPPIARWLDFVGSLKILLKTVPTFFVLLSMARVGDLIGDPERACLVRCSREAPRPPGERSLLFRTESVSTERSLNSGDRPELGSSMIWGGFIHSRFELCWRGRSEGIFFLVFKDFTILLFGVKWAFVSSAARFGRPKESETAS
jgi:hypothetical protein